MMKPRHLIRPLLTVLLLLAMAACTRQAPVRDVLPTNPPPSGSPAAPLDTIAPPATQPATDTPAPDATPPDTIPTTAAVDSPSATPSPFVVTSPTDTEAPTDTPPPPPADTATPEGPPGIVIHVVQAGDNLYRIGLRYGVTVDAIKAANNLPNDTIYVGQELVIPPPP